MKPERIEIQCEFGTIVAEIGCDPDYKEIFVGIERDGVWIQDLAVIRPSYHYDIEGKVELENTADVLVYGDVWQEDYTDKYIIPIYADNESEAVNS